MGEVVSIRVDEERLARFDKAARARGLSRAAAFSRAMDLWAAPALTPRPVAPRPGGRSFTEKAARQKRVPGQREEKKR